MRYYSIELELFDLGFCFLFNFCFVFWFLCFVFYVKVLCSSLFYLIYLSFARLSLGKVLISVLALPITVRRNFCVDLIYLILYVPLWLVCMWVCGCGSFMLQLCFCIIGRCTWGFEFFVLFILAPVRSNLCVIDLCTPVLKLLIYLNCGSDVLYFWVWGSWFEVSKVLDFGGVPFSIFIQIFWVSFYL